MNVNLRFYHNTWNVISGKYFEIFSFLDPSLIQMSKCYGPSFYKREKNDLFSIEPLTGSKGRPLQIGEMSSRLRLWVCLPPFHVRGIFPIKRGQEKAVRFPLYVSHISSSPASYYLGIRTINISCPVKGQNLFNKASGSCCFDRGYK